MSFQQEVTNYACFWCGQMVQTTEIKEIGLKEGYDNVSVYKSHSLSGMEGDYGVCRTCKEIINQIIDERLSSNTKTKNE